jgi:hypothetical protein
MEVSTEKAMFLVSTFAIKPGRKVAYRQAAKRAYSEVKCRRFAGRATSFLVIGFFRPKTSVSPSWGFIKQ